MCGIFGFVSHNGHGPDLRRLEQIARATQRRGPHAFGFAWIDERGRLRMFKQTGRISDHLGLLAMAVDAKMLIGHCRYATHGSPDNNLNNHPHPVDGGWLVHNGVIHDVDRVIEENALHPVSECDSEVLGLLIEELDGSLVERCIDAVHLAGDAPLAMAAVWRNPQRLVVVRSGNPLHFGETPGGHYFGSLIGGLPRGSTMLRDNAALSFSIRKGQAKMVGFDASPAATY